MTDLDRLVDAVTASPTWSAFEAAMKSGYCPTLRPEFGRRTRLLAKVVRAKGYRAFTPEPQRK
jgi:hypothetical protein